MVPFPYSYVIVFQLAYATVTIIDMNRMVLNGDFRYLDSYPVLGELIGQTTYSSSYFAQKLPYFLLYFSLILSSNLYLYPLG